MRILFGRRRTLENAKNNADPPRTHADPACNGFLANQVYLVTPPLQLFSPEDQRLQGMQIEQRFLLAITR